MTWDETVEQLRTNLDSIHTAREQALQQSRKLIQTCSRCIRCCHRHEFAEAQKLLDQAREISSQARAEFASIPEVLYAGYLQDAEKELVEAAAVLAMTTGQELPAQESLKVQTTSFLNGMGEAASEARRYLLDLLRAGEYGEAERLLKTMETIYDDLITFDYPDGVTGGLRRTCDALRAVIERTRSDLTLTLVQDRLLTQLQKS